MPKDEIRNSDTLDFMHEFDRQNTTRLEERAFPSKFPFVRQMLSRCLMIVGDVLRKRNYDFSVELFDPFQRCLDIHADGFVTTRSGSSLTSKILIRVKPTAPPYESNGCTNSEMKRLAAELKRLSVACPHYLAYCLCVAYVPLDGDLKQSGPIAWRMPLLIRRCE